MNFFKRFFRAEPKIKASHPSLEHEPPYTLGEKQKIFTRLLAELIKYAYDEGYELTLSEAFRTKEQAELNAKRGIGIRNSLHRKRLAIDLNLFRNGAYLSSTNAHKPLGEFWESLSTPGLNCCWGGRFNDGGHYSIQHGRVK